jgi:hypothetical protein
MKESYARGKNPRSLVFPKLDVNPIVKFEPAQA